MLPVADGYTYMNMCDNETRVVRRAGRAAVRRGGRRAAQQQRPPPVPRRRERPLIAPSRAMNTRAKRAKLARDWHE